MSFVLAPCDRFAIPTSSLHRRGADSHWGSAATRPEVRRLHESKSAQTPRRRDLIEKQVQIRAAQIAINKDDLISQKGQTQSRCAVSVDLPVPPLPPATGQITVDGAGVSRTMAFESSATGSGRRGAGRGRSWTVMGLASVDDLQHCIREERRAGRQVCKNKGL
jgi:hypothetical protein